MSNDLGRYYLHLCREIPNILQILTFQAFLAILVHNALLIGLVTSVLCSAYLSARPAFYGENRDVWHKDIFAIADLAVGLLVGVLSAQVAVEIVKAIN